uniref:Neur_chan_LBD domain-containing protein n=1 Tax=Heterorhabditis bacteriophora TaxID=37862 RepID=A0A1I7WGW6_HETBA
MENYGTYQRITLHCSLSSNCEDISVCNLETSWVANTWPPGMPMDRVGKRIEWKHSKSRDNYICCLCTLICFAIYVSLFSKSLIKRKTAATLSVKLRNTRQQRLGDKLSDHYFKGFD